MGARPVFGFAVGDRRAFSIPGIRTHYVLRKKIIEREVRNAIADGCRQVVVVGAGYDVLAFRLAAEFPLVTFTEFDHPATQSVKRLVGERFGSTVRFVSGDLRNTIDIAIDPAKETVFVVEGVLMYFDEAQVIAILDSLRRAAAKGRVIFTAMESDQFAGATFLARWWLQRQGEPFRWALPQAAVAGFLEPIGVNVVRVDGVLGIGEYVVVAQW
jgi:methyltransferase (TIGR00027 family)